MKILPIEAIRIQYRVGKDSIKRTISSYEMAVPYTSSNVKNALVRERNGCQFGTELGSGVGLILVSDILSTARLIILSQHIINLRHSTAIGIVVQ